MICIDLKEFTRVCQPTTGGISDIVTFDPDDFNWTQPAAVAGVAQPYSAVALRDDAIGTGATAATATVTITAIGVDGDIIAVYYGSILLGTFTKTATESTVTLLAAALAAAITAGTSGFTAANVAGVITVTAPTSYGAAINGDDLIVDATGGIDYTKAAFDDGVTGTGGKMYNVQFLRDEAEWAWKHSAKGCSVKYEHTFTFQLPENSHNLTTFLQALDAASCCCGLGLVIRLSSGKIFVCGEKWVNDTSIPRFTVLQNGSSGSSGKLYDDFNGGTLVLTGPYSRSLYEYAGDWADITALMPA
jgi:hypothetical protein